MFESKEELTKFLDEWWIDRQRKDETIRWEGRRFLHEQEMKNPGMRNGRKMGEGE